MLQSIKQTLFTQWTLLRWIRLIAGIIFGVQAIQLQDSIAAFVSFLFLFQAATNTGCCGVGGCSIPSEPKNTTPTHEVEYEEIKEK